MRRAFVPEELKHGPFTLDEARLAGLSKTQLAGRAWRRVGPRTYIWSGLRRSSELQLQAALLRLPAAAVFGGWTAAWAHGITAERGRLVEVVLPKGMGVSAKAAVAVRRGMLAPDDVVRVRGWPVTSVERTLRDLSARSTLVDAVVLLDAALHAGLLDLPRLSAWIESRAGSVGVLNLRRAVRHADPGSESPMETRLRMLLVLNGLPRPDSQVTIADRAGAFAGRVDLYYPGAALGIEYDGFTHRDSVAEDNRRQNRLLAAGIRLLRYTAGDIANAPDRVVAEVRGELVRRRAA